MKFFNIIKRGTNMKRQAAFEKKGSFLKGGLHCHTTRSDGAGTPEEVMALHKENGYDFLAITDHRRYNFKNFAPELDLLIIPGMEFDNGRIPDPNGLRCFHTVCIGPSKEDGNGFEQFEDTGVIPKAVAYNQEAYQPYLDEIHAKKNLTVYCHPEWSGTSAKYFERMRGNFAMEIWNSGCAEECEMDTDARYWDELLGQGVKIYGVATDDGHKMSQHCNGWVMVNAEKDINSILAALENGEFYSSCGPEIYDFYVEDGKAIIECSPVVKARIHADGHPTRIHRAENGVATRFEFNVGTSWKGEYPYVRMSVVDEQGRKAWTNPIYLK